MNTKKQTYRLVGIFTALIYLIIIILSIFAVEEFKFIDVAMKLLAIFFTPAIFILFAGIGEILDNIKPKELTDVNVTSNKGENEEIEPIQMEIPLDDTKKEKLENEDALRDDEEVDEKKTEEDTNSKDIKESNDEKSTEYNYEPDVKNGKIRCRYCGKYNKEKRTYCYLCAKKLKD